MFSLARICIYIYIYVHCEFRELFLAMEYHNVHIQVYVRESAYICMCMRTHALSLSRSLFFYLAVTRARTHKCTHIIVVLAISRTHTRTHTHAHTHAHTHTHTHTHAHTHAHTYAHTHSESTFFVYDECLFNADITETNEYFIHVNAHFISHFSKKSKLPHPQTNLQIFSTSCYIQCSEMQRVAVRCNLLQWVTK